jgi:hypothetical protein
MVTVALAPGSRLPSAQVTVPSLFSFEVIERVQVVPWGAGTERNTALAGSGTFTFTPVACAPPVLVTLFGVFALRAE